MRQAPGPGRLVNVAVAVAVAVGVFALGVVLIVKGSSSGNTAEIIGGAFLVVCMSVAPVAVGGKLVERLLRRHVPGAAPPAIELAVRSERLAPGQTVDGHVTVTQGGHVRGLAVTLRCRDRTGDYSGTSTELAAPTLAAGELAAAAEYPFRLALPPDAPPSYSGDGFTIWWELVARCDVFGSDVTAVRQIEVAAAPAAS